ncbi:putative mitochondrial protein, partial [Mucuna pruriens]
MEIPPRFEYHSIKNKVCKLNKQSQVDHTLFIKHFLVYVDDIIIVGDDEIDLATHFEMKELEKLKYFLEVEVAYSKKSIFISQRKYALDLLKEERKLRCIPQECPLNKNHKIGSEESPPVEKSRY